MCLALRIQSVEVQARNSEIQSENYSASSGLIMSTNVSARLMRVTKRCNGTPMLWRASTSPEPVAPFTVKSATPGM